MHVHRIVGASLREALQRARRIHGENAVVINQELSAAGGVTLTIVRKPAAALPPPVGTGGKAASKAPGAPQDLALVEVASRLRLHGASPAFVDRVLADIAVRRTGAEHVLDVAADAIGGLFQVAKLPRARGKARVVALAGAGGVGKTTTIAKLALRLVRAQRRVELVTFDAERPGAVEQLRAWADLLHAPFRVARSGSEIATADIATADLILVDTSGRPERDVTRIERMRAVCTAAGADLETYVVLSAGASTSTLRAITATLSRLDPAAVVVTKLDETREPIAVLELVLEANLPVAFLSDGPDVHAHLHRAEPGVLADLCLRGKVA